MATDVEADYLVIGAGAMGLAFLDTVLTSNPAATFALVDKFARPGGHWTTAYPFVRLHQPSAHYGVNSKHLGQDNIDQVGLNKGLYGLASADEVCAYYSQVINETFLPSGKVRYFRKCQWNGGRDFSQTSQAKHLNPIYATAIYHVAKDIEIVTPNDLTKLSRPYINYTIVGSGKTGIDTAIWLLTMGVQPHQITWIMPRDAWLYDRAFSKPFCIKKQRCSEEAIRMYHAGQVLRLDKNIWPTSFRCATVSLLELDEIRKIQNVVRLGRIVSISAEEVVLQRGVQQAKPDTVYIDCSADGLEKREQIPIFTPEKITLQPVRYCQQVFSAAFIGHVEAAYSDESTKNELCTAVSHPMVPADMAICLYHDYQAMLRWSMEPKIVNWLVNSRLNWSSAFGPLATDDAEKLAEARKRLRSHVGSISEKLKGNYRSVAGQGGRTRIGKDLNYVCGGCPVESVK